MLSRPAWNTTKISSDGHIEQINGDCFDKAEAYLKFDSDRKAKNKAAKKAKKLAAKKQAVSESKADSD